MLSWTWNRRRASVKLPLITDERHRMRSAGLQNKSGEQKSPSKRGFVVSDSASPLPRIEELLQSCCIRATAV